MQRHWNPQINSSSHFTKHSPCNKLYILALSYTGLFNPLPNSAWCALCTQRKLSLLKISTPKIRWVQAHVPQAQLSYRIYLCFPPQVYISWVGSVAPSGLGLSIRQRLILFTLYPQYLKLNHCSLVFDCTISTKCEKIPWMWTLTDYYLTDLKWYLCSGRPQSKGTHFAPSLRQNGLAAWHSGLLPNHLGWVGRPPTPIFELLLGPLKVTEGLGQLWTQDRKCQSSPTSFPPRRVKTVSGQTHMAARVQGCSGVRGSDSKRQKKASPPWAHSGGPSLPALSLASPYSYKPCSVCRQVWPFRKPHPPQVGLSAPDRPQT